MSLRTVTRTRRWIAGAGALAATFPAFTLAQLPKPGQDDAQPASGESYTSPELGFTVEWGEPWVELERSAADSFATMGEESITLNATGFDGFLGLYAIDPARDAASPAGLVAFYGDLADRKLANEPPTTAALIERSNESFTALFLVEYGEAGEGGLMYEFWELRVDPGSDYATYVLLAGPADAFAGFFETAQSAVAMNGDTPFTAVSDDEIQTAAENGTGTGLDNGNDATTGVDDAVLTVRDHFDELRPTVSELAELTGIESLTEAEADRFNQIVELWIAAPTFAAGVDLPVDHAAIGDAYLAYTANLGTAGEAIVTLFTPDIPEDEFDAAERDLGTAIDADADLATTLDDLLTAAGA